MLFGTLAPQKSPTLALESMMAPMNRAGAGLIKNELQAKTNCPHANVDGFVDTNDFSSSVNDEFQTRAGTLDTGLGAQKSRGKGPSPNVSREKHQQPSVMSCNHGNGFCCQSN